MKKINKEKLLKDTWELINVKCKNCSSETSMYFRVNNYIEDIHGDLQKVLIPVLDEVWAECPSCKEITLFAP